MDPLYEIFGVALGYLIATLIRSVSRRRFWNRVEGNAKRMLSDPNNPIDTPVDAAEAALAHAQRDQVIAIARTVSEQIMPPQRGRTPLQSVNLHEVDNGDTKDR